MTDVHVVVDLAKALLSVLLVVSGGAKLADAPGFAGTVRLFVPVRLPGVAIRGCAMGIAAGEAAIGAVSLAWPSTKWPNLAIFALACVFVCVSIAGYVFYRDWSCRCFGALSHRKFDIPGLLRAVLIAGAAVIPILGPGRPGAQVDAVSGGLLAAGAVLLAWAAFTAARALGSAMGGQPI